MSKTGGQLDDEYCHAHSEHLRRVSERLEKQGQDRRVIAEFAHFACREDSSILPTIGAILATGTHGNAAGFLGITDAGFARMRDRLSQLASVLWMESQRRGSEGRTRNDGRQ
jgi:hypothetical protein